ncbi:MAG: gamma-glutamylcyclotransferase, partial [Myxococcales bacterium]|nr:gamma-glutamylcyclotransferase [Myxococcales bacterium]
MTPRLFVYGTLAPGRSNAYVLASLAGTWERGSVLGTLHAEGWGAAAGYPGIVLDPGGTEVDGFLFTSPDLAA